jgi:hypothetical protein
MVRTLVDMEASYLSASFFRYVLLTLCLIVWHCISPQAACESTSCWVTYRLPMACVA